MNLMVNGELILYGTVGDDLWGEGFTSRQVVDALAGVNREEDITVRINSGGGYVDEGVGIYSSLVAHKGKVTVMVDGIAASAASLIAMAGDEIVMRRGSTMMIHDPSMITIGTADDHAKSIEELGVYVENFSSIYADRSGKDRDAVRADMRDEVWFTAEKAVEAGYADRVDEARAERPTMFAFHLYKNAPRAIMSQANTSGPSKATRKAAASAASSRIPGVSPMSTTPTADTPAAPVALTEADISRRVNEAVAVTMAAHRNRVSAILALPEAEGRNDLAAHFANDTEMTVDQAKAALTKAPKASAAPAAPSDPFARAMAAAGNPNVGPDAPGSDTSGGLPPISAKANMLRLVGGK